MRSRSHGRTAPMDDSSLLATRAKAENVCIWCGGHYKPKSMHPNPHRVYCCQACQKQAWRRDIRAEAYSNIRAGGIRGNKGPWKPRKEVINQGDFVKV